MTTPQPSPLPTVSVVIPAYNAMNYLPETLDSALNQTFQDFEVVIINDGSTDPIETWVGQLNHPKVRLISQENRGLAAARNAGILAARGELIAFLDADDLWAPNKLAAQVEMFARSPGVGLVYSWVANINAQGKETGRVLCSTAEGSIWPELLRGNCIGCGSVPMVRRECFEVLGAFDTQLGSSNEDWDMWLRLAAVYPIRVVKEVLVYYRQHPNSASRNWLQMERTSKIVLEKAFSAWGKGDWPRQDPKERIPHLYHQQIKREAYGNTYLSLAWQPLQCRQKNLRESLRLLSIALGHRRNILFSKEFLRLGLAIVLTAVFRDQYSQILHQLQQTRHQIKRIWQPRRPHPARIYTPQLPNRQPAETVASNS
ncbi:MAG: glycosyltransferase family 2 protein [Synechococcales cyanobacterium CRU_2_2]|nr:glycosyltransferase family 2 protein [Synechococcales cyanobacterium CRU_2_2]